uniref:Cyclin-dependent kinase inhibitor 2A/B (p15, inhibits CDK4) n=1 Tax=Paramormyrops kingsleyae TaxID=1676925 RepID=A0A3B3SLY1_9TELE
MTMHMNLEDELASAAANGNTGIVGRLLQNGADANAANSFGRTPLQVAMMGSSAVVKLLLENGADPNKPDNTGTTPLHDAARDGFCDTVQILVQYHANLNMRDQWNRRPIDLAREHGHQDLVAFLESL